MERVTYLIGTAAIFVLLFCSSGESSSTAPKASVTVGERAHVSSPTLTLGAIAAITGKDRQLVERLKAVKLGRAPDPGAVKELSSHSIETKIRHSGADPESLALTIPETVTVTSEGILVSPEKIENMVRKFILTQVPWDSEDVTVSVSPVEGFTLPVGTVTCQVIPRRKEDYLGTTNLQVAFMVDGRMEKKCWVTASIDALGEVVISTRPLDRHCIITGEDVRLEKMHLADLQGGVITDPAEVIGKRTRRAIDANTPLRLTFLEIAPLVKRGDMVTIVAETEVLKITTRGLVTESGRKGDLVRVININSRKELFAKVVDSRTVEVDF